MVKSIIKNITLYDHHHERIGQVKSFVNYSDFVRKMTDEHFEEYIEEKRKELEEMGR